MSRVKKVLLILLVSSSCGDDLDYVPTYRDAWERWSESLCLYLERCLPENYPRDEHKKCVDATAYDSCHSSWNDCDDEWTNAEADMVACEEGMLTLTCGSWLAPEACARAVR